MKVIEGFIANYLLFYQGGFMTLLFGLLKVHCDNVWEFRWIAKITVMGWIGIASRLMIDWLKRLHGRDFSNRHGSYYR